MPYAYNRGTRIYYRVIGEGPALVMQHGFTSSLDHWFEYGYTCQLADEYRLILIDARGHGLSDKPHTIESYKLEHRVQDVISVLDQQDIQTANFHGYSMGGRIGFGMAQFAAERLKSLIVGGMHPYSSDNDSPSSRWSKILDQEDIEQVAKTLEAQSGPMGAAHRERFLRNDPKALLASINGSTNMPMGIDLAVTRAECPIMLYVGEDDEYSVGVRKLANSLDGCEFVSFPGLKHLEVSRKSAYVIPHLKSFLKVANADRSEKAMN